MSPVDAEFHLKSSSYCGIQFCLLGNISIIKPVSERRDHESVGTSEVLVHVVEVHVSDGDKTVICLLFEVESALF